jgi:hypothetical protein
MVNPSITPSFKVKQSVANLRPRHSSSIGSGSLHARRLWGLSDARARRFALKQFVRSQFVPAG